MLILKPITITANIDQMRKTGLFNAMSLLLFYYLYNQKEWTEIGLSQGEYEKLLEANLISAKPVIQEIHADNRDWNTLITLIKTKKFWSSNQDDDIIYDMADSIYANRKAIDSSTFFDADQKAFINHWQLVIRKDDPDAKPGSPEEKRQLSRKQRLKREIGGMTSPDVAKWFPTTMKETIDEHKKASKLVETLKPKVTKKNGEIDTGSPNYKAYQNARKETRESSLAIRDDFIRQNGGILDVKEVRRYLDKHDVTHTIPKGFIGMIGENNTYYTKFGEELDGRPTGTVTMNKVYKEGSSNWYFEALSDNSATGKAGKFYTKKAKARSNEKKFAASNIFAENMKRYKVAWRRLLKQKIFRENDPDDKGSLELQCGIMLEIMYWTAARIGTVGNRTIGVGKTYGVLTMLNKHIKVKGNVVKVHYKGKRGGDVKMEFNPSKAGDEKKFLEVVINYLKRSKKLGNPSDRVFNLTSANPLRKLMHGKLGMDESIGPHKFRHVRGTILMKELMPAAMKRLGDDPDPKKVLEEFDTITKKVGKALGHYSTAAGGTTGATAIKNYIDPSFMQEYFDRYPNVKVPANVKTVLKNINKDE